MQQPIKIVNTEKVDVEVPFTPQMMFWRDVDKTQKYREDLYVPNPHYGQVKLLISELAFLLYFSPIDQDITVVYVGAAAGNHIRFLVDMFPRIKWYLYDSSPFYENLNGLDTVTIHNRYFEDNDAEQFKNKENVFFISDIRTVDPVTRKTTVENTNNDMMLQKQWVETIRPVSALLKMKLPFSEKHTSKYYKYLDGIIMYGIFSPSTSAETRLIVNRPEGDYPVVDYDTGLYDNRVASYNVRTRAALRYTNPISDKDLTTDIINNHFDSRAFLYLCHLYYTTYNGSQDPVAGAYALYNWIWRDMNVNASDKSFTALYPPNAPNKTIL